MPRIWQDRIVEKPRTFTIQNNPDGTITLIPAPGAIIQVGTPVNATMLNSIEDDARLSGDIPNTIQTPTFDRDNITKIEHRTGANIVRTDNFTYTSALIIEVRTLTSGATLTLKYYFNVDGSYNRTEVS